MPELIVTKLPKSSSGRKAEPLDNSFLTALVADVKKRGAKVDAEGDRPFFVCSDRYDTKGKASGTGRRYADAVKEQAKVERVSVRVFPDGKKFGWGIYLPLDQSNGESES